VSAITCTLRRASQRFGGALVEDSRIWFEENRLNSNSKHPSVGGNQLYLICTICGNDAANALLLAERKIDSSYAALSERRALEKFFDRHAECGGTRDKFKLALGHPADWDAVEFADPANNLKAAVRLALVKE
jgi:hypothetical protein